MTVLATAVVMAKYIPDLVNGIKEGADLIARIQAGDMTAEEQARDWLGITDKFQEAKKAWEDSNDAAQEG